MAHPHSLGLRQMATKANNNVPDDDQQQQQQQLQQPQLQQQQQQPQQQQRQLQQNHLQVNNSSQFSQPVDFRMKRHPELQPCVPRDKITLTSSRRPINGSAGGSSNLTVKANLHSKPVNKSTNRTNNTAAGPFNNTNEDRLNNPSTGQPKKCVSMTRLDQLAQPKNRNFKKEKSPVQTPPNRPVNSNRPAPNHRITPTLTASGQSASQKQPTPSLVNSSSNNNNHQHHNNNSNQRQSTPGHLTTSHNNTTTNQRQSTAGLANQRQSTPGLPNKSSQPVIISQSTPNQQQQSTSNQNNLNNQTSLNQTSTNNTTFDQTSQSEEVTANDTTFNHTTLSYTTPTKDFSNNLGSLYNDLEADLIAEGVIRRETIKPTTPPTATIEAKEQDTTDIINREEEERRIKAEEDLKEVARREEQERQNRQLLVESILSKMNHSSISQE